MVPRVKKEAMRAPQESTAWPEVAIIVLNWNGWRESIECLESVRSLVYPHYRVIVVDNGSADDSVDELRGWLRRTGWGDGPRGRGQPADARAVLVENAENLGFAEGVNIGIECAFAAPTPPEFVFLLNNDARLEPSAIAQCVNVSRDQDAAIVGAVIRSLDGAKVLFAGAKFPRELFVADRKAVRTTVEGEGRSWTSARAEASAVLIRRDVIEARLRKFGYLLNPALFMYGEETELCLWARAEGLRVLIARDAIAYHGVGRSGGGAESPLMSYYQARNKVLLARWLLPLPQRVAFFVWYFPFRMGRAIQRLLLGRPVAARATLQGVLDGYRSVTGKWARHPLTREERR